MPDRVAAFFDVDHTLIEINSARAWLKHLWETGQISALGVLRSFWWLALYRVGRLDYDSMTKVLMKDYAGRSVAELEAEVGSWFQTAIVPTICVQARTALEEHRAKGHILVLLTSGTTFSIRPLQRLLGLEHALCTELEERDGRLTGQCVGIACYGAGKVTHAERFAAQHDIDLSRSYFYTDSISDLPMLERVGEPRVINPDRILARMAQSRGWGIQRWSAAG